MINGLKYIDNFISLDEQNNLINLIDKNKWDISLERRSQHYGYKCNCYFINYSTEIPDFLKNYCQLMVDNKYFKEMPNQVTIDECLPGQGTISNIDCMACYANIIVSLSLNSSCIMEFEHSEENDRKHILLKPLSLLILSGEARYSWMHAIPMRVSDEYNGNILPRGRRISLTFRKVILSKICQLKTQNFQLQPKC